MSNNESIFDSLDISRSEYFTSSLHQRVFAEWARESGFLKTQFYSAEDSSIRKVMISKESTNSTQDVIYIPNNLEVWELVQVTEAVEDYRSENGLLTEHKRTEATKKLLLLRFFWKQRDIIQHFYTLIFLLLKYGKRKCIIMR